MNLGLGSGGLPLPYNSPRENGWLPLSTVGPTPVHLITTVVSLLLGRSFRSSLQGAFRRRDCYFKQFNLCRGTADAVTAVCTACLCFFDGKSSKNKSKHEGSSSLEASTKSSFLRGRWTTALLAINVLLYVAQLATKGKLMLWGAKINNLIDEGQIWRLVTSSFLHTNIGHLMVNCYSLNSVGPTVGRICGSRRFFTIYFASAVASSAMSYWLSQHPAVGASGAIFGLVGSVAVFSLRQRNLLGSGTQDLQHIARFIILNLIIGLSSRGIDNWGHLGGLLGGVAISWLVGPAWTYNSTTSDGRKVFVDRAPISFFTSKKPQRLK